MHQNLGNSSFSSFNLLNKVFEVQHFSDMKIAQYAGMKIINANAHGENYIFGVRNNMYFSFQDIETIYHISEKEHIHNVIVVTSSKKYIHASIWPKIKDYNIEVWDNEKLYSLISESSSTLKTSDTSDDHCEIEKDSSSPIHETSESSGLFDSLFDKPDRL